MLAQLIRPNKIHQDLKQRLVDHHESEYQLQSVGPSSASKQNMANNDLSANGAESARSNAAVTKAMGAAVIIVRVLAGMVVNFSEYVSTRFAEL